MRVINTEYARYLSSPAWRKKREQRLRYDNFHCTRCDSTEKLEVHHLQYGNLGNEPLSDLETLCNACHAREHGRDPSLPPLGGLRQRDLSERGESKYWLERWQHVVEKAIAADSALAELRFELRRSDDGDWVFNEVGALLAMLMRNYSWGHGYDWDMSREEAREATGERRAA